MGTTSEIRVQFTDGQAPWLKWERYIAYLWTEAGPTHWATGETPEQAEGSLRSFLAA